VKSKNETKLVGVQQTLSRAKRRNSKRS